MTAAYKHLTSPASFITKYMEWCDASETPYSFDFWSAVFCVSAVLRRRCYVDRPGAPVWPNHYILLTAPPGVARKTTAVIRATEIVQWYASASKSNATLFSGSLTSSMLMKEMAVLSKEFGCSPLLLALPELSRSFARNAARPTIAYLTDMFDTKEIERGGTKREGTYEIKKASINMLAASTPEWLGAFGGADADAGGFTSRCIVVREERPKRRIKWGEVPTQPDAAVVRSAIIDIDERLAQLERHEGPCREVPIKATAAAIARYESYREASDTKLRSSEARHERHVLSVACVLACADLTFEIQEDHIINAIKAIELVTRDDPKRLEDDTSHNVNADVDRPIDKAWEKRIQIFTRIVKILKEAGKLGVQQQKMCIRLRHLTGAKDVRLVLKILLDYNCVQCFRVSEVGRPSMVWRATYLIDTPAVERARILYAGEPITEPSEDQSPQESDQSTPPYH